MKPLALLCAGLLAGGPLAAQEAPAAAVPAAPAEEVLRPPEPGRFQPLFQPFRTERAALSPDGKYLAYSVRENGAVSVIVLEIDQPTVIKAKVKVVDDNGASPMLAANQYEPTPARINWLGWATPQRLVVETNQSTARTGGTDATWQNWHGAVFGFDADGGNARLLARPQDLREFLIDNTSARSFAVERSNTTTFDGSIWTPDQPIPTMGEPAEARSQSPRENTPSLLDTPQPGTHHDATGSSEPRNLQVVGLDPKRPGAVLISAIGAPRNTGLHTVSLYSLHAESGRITEVAYDLVLNNRSALSDRQGHVRLLQPNSLLSSFPFRYMYTGPKGASRPQPLDQVTDLTGFSVSPDNFFGTRAIPVGFDEDPDILYYASNQGRDTYGLYSYNLATRKPGRISLENPAYDLLPFPSSGFVDRDNLVFDRFTHQLVGMRYEQALRTTVWFQPDLKAMQAEFERQFPGRSVEISEWDEHRQRFLVATQGPADPGAFFLYDRRQNKLLEFVRRAPWVDAHQVHASLPFSYATPDGATITGLVTVPRQPRLKPIPMVVLCPDFPWQRVQSGFQTEVQALASMGFVVVQLNGRGAWGLGLKQRQSLTAGYDLVQVEDIVTTVTNLEKLFHVNLRRVALLGRGHGGFIALRTLQAHPDKFRCAIALDAPVNLAAWLEEQKWTDDKVLPHLTRAWLGDRARLQAVPLAGSPETLTRPALMLNYPGLDGAPRRGAYLAARSFASRVRSRGGSAEFADLSTDYMLALPAARAAVFDQIEAFLNLHVYDFNVKLHDLKVLK